MDRSNVFVVPIIPKCRYIKVEWLFDQWNILRRTYNIKSHADLADLEKIDYDAWVWGIKLEQILTRIIQQKPELAYKLYE